MAEGEIKIKLGFENAEKFEKKIAELLEKIEKRANVKFKINIEDLDELGEALSNMKSTLMDLSKIKAIPKEAFTDLRRLEKEYVKAAEAARHFGDVTSNATIKTSRGAQEIIRIVQDLPFGFFGITNNIQSLFDAIVIQAQKTGRKMSEVWSETIRSILTGPMGVALLASALTTVILQWDLVSDKMNKFLGALGLVDAKAKELAKSIKEAQTEFAKKFVSSLPDEELDRLANLLDKLEEVRKSAKLKIFERVLTGGEGLFGRDFFGREELDQETGRMHDVINAINTLNDIFSVTIGKEKSAREAAEELLKTIKNLKLPDEFIDDQMRLVGLIENFIQLQKETSKAVKILEQFEELSMDSFEKQRRKLNKMFIEAVSDATGDLPLIQRLIKAYHKALDQVDKEESDKLFKERIARRKILTDLMVKSVRDEHLREILSIKEFAKIRRLELVRQYGEMSDIVKAFDEAIAVQIEEAESAHKKRIREAREAAEREFQKFIESVERTSRRVGLLSGVTSLPPTLDVTDLTKVSETERRRILLAQQLERQRQQIKQQQRILRNTLAEELRKINESKVAIRKKYAEILTALQTETDEEERERLIKHKNELEAILMNKKMEEVSIISETNAKILELDSKRTHHERENTMERIKLTKLEMDLKLAYVQSAVSSFGAAFESLATITAEKTKEGFEQNKTFLYLSAVADSIAAGISVVRGLLATVGPLSPFQIASAIASGIAITTQLLARAKQIDRLDESNSSGGFSGGFLALNPFIDRQRIANLEAARSARTEANISEQLRRVANNIQNQKVILETETAAKSVELGKRENEKFVVVG